MNSILVIDDDELIRELLRNVINKAGYQVTDAADGETGLKLASQKDFDLVITDYRMPGITGVDVVTELTHKHPGLPVILLTAYGDVTLTIKAIQSGAYDFIEKPVKNHELLEAIQNGIRASAQSRSLRSIITPELRKEIEDNIPAGKTPIMRDIFKKIGRLSLNKVNVVITGESGTGKRQIARLIHYSGINREQPFETVYCSSADEAKLERELFGQSGNLNDNGTATKKGKLELAGEGTIYLDEFNELPERLQKRLLWAFLNGGFEKPGTQESVAMSARFIVATKSDIEKLVDEKLFLRDLYFRLNMVSIHLPPIRERKDDIPELVESLLVKLNRKLNKHVVKVEDGVFDLLKAYHWPGNIRELENTLTQAVVLSHGDVLEKKNIPIFYQQYKNKKEPVNQQLVSLEEIEKSHIQTVLNSLNWNKMEASRVLQITRPTLNKKIEKYRLFQHK